MQTIKGFKVTDENMQCLGFQYELNKKFTHEGDIEICDRGFHFCQKLNHCFNYYTFTSKNRVFEIEASGQTETNGDKTCASEITFLKELTWAEVLSLANTGIDNTGHSNSGYRNSGNWNSGDSNSGDWNSGDWNSGNWNSGDWNSGNRNSGYRNSGNWNSGNWNSGNWNSGNWNSGNRNSGDSNSGDWNSGNRNSGYRNSGNWNSGNWNSGDWNSGNWNSGNRNSGNWNSGNWNSGNSNSGNWNSGNRNSGDSNSGYRNAGAFCTNSNPMLELFDLPTKITVKEWEKMEVCNLMYSIEPTIWVPMSIMTEEEKKNYPKYKTTEGYLKAIPIKESWANFWGNLQDEKKILFTSLPNFDSNKFYQITGIKI